MAGASITVEQVTPILNKKLIYFSVTLDNQAKADFSAYKSVDYVEAVRADTLANNPTTAYTAGGDITFTTHSQAVKGIALVNL